jgi:hypothetical protein
MPKRKMDKKGVYKGSKGKKKQGVEKKGLKRENEGFGFGRILDAL